MADRNLLDEYVAIRQDIKLLEERRRQIEPVVLKYVKFHNYEPIHTPHGSLKVRKLKVWMYPKALIEKVSKLKKQASLEEKQWQINHPTKFAQPEEKYSIVWEGHAA